MGKGPRVRDIELFPAPAHLERTGLVCWVCFSLSGLRFHDVGLRRTGSRSYALSWPRIRGQEFTDRCAVHPVNDVARQAFEDIIVAEAKRQGFLE